MHASRPAGCRPRARCRVPPLLLPVLLSMLLWAGVAAPVPLAALPVLSVATDGLTPAEVGARLGAVTKAAFPDLEARWDSALAALLVPAQMPAQIAAQVAALQAEGIDAATRAEVMGFASALDLVGRTQLGDGHLSLEEFWLVQFLPDLVPLAAGSALALHGREAPPRLGRNLDLPASAALRGLQAINRWQGARETVVSPGLAGFLGVLNGFNAHGVYAALLTGPRQRRAPGAGAGEQAIGFAVRTALARQDRAAGAARLLRRQAFLSSHSVLLGDAREALVLELPAGQPALQRRDDSATRPEMPWGRPGRLAVVTCLVAADAPGGCPDLGDRFRWQRLRQLVAGGGPAGPAGPAGTEAMPPVDLEALLFDQLPRGYGLFNEATAQSLIFEPATGDLLLYAGGAAAPRPGAPLLQRYAGLAGTAGGDPGPAGAWVWVLMALLLAGAAAALWRLDPARSTKRPSQRFSTRSATRNQ